MHLIVFEYKHVLVSNHVLAFVCPLVSQRVMESVFLFLQDPPWPQLFNCITEATCVHRSFLEANQLPHQPSAYLRKYFCFLICSKSQSAPLSPFGPCLCSVVTRVILIFYIRLSHWGSECCLQPHWIPNLDSEYTAHVWINVQMSTTGLPNVVVMACSQRCLVQFQWRRFGGSKWHFIYAVSSC